MGLERPSIRDGRCAPFTVSFMRSRRLESPVVERPIAISGRGATPHPLPNSPYQLRRATRPLESLETDDGFETRALWQSPRLATPPQRH
jgi:hypothetical protein